MPCHLPTVRTLSVDRGLHRASLFGLVASLVIACVGVGGAFAPAPSFHWIPACAGMTATACAGMTEAAPPSSGYSERPIGAAVSSGSLAEGSMQFFRNKNFDGEMTAISEATASTQPWRAQSFGTWAKHFSSLRWSLPRGVIVTLYEDDDGRGRTINLWGSGEIASLSAWKLDNKLSGWSWNYVGGVAAPPKAMKDAWAERPRFAKATTGVAAESMQAYKNRDVKGDAVEIARLFEQPANTFHAMPKEAGGTSSLKWNVPEGVVVTFAEKPDGVGQQMAVWGNGQFDTFAHWQMNDKMKFWAWHWVGEKR